VRQIDRLAEDAIFKGDILNRNFQAKITNLDGTLKHHVHVRWYIMPWLQRYIGQPIYLFLYTKIGEKTSIHIQS